MSIKFPDIIVKSESSGIPTWADATFDQIRILLLMHDRGEINIYDYWSVGDKKDVELGVIENWTTPGGNTFYGFNSSQILTWELMDTSYANNSNIHFVVGTEDCLNSPREFHLDEYDPTSPWIYGWHNSNIRTWLNSSFKNALPAGFLKLFKQMTIKSATGATIQDGEHTTTTVTTVNDYFALFAAKEVTNSALGYYSIAEENAVLSKVQGLSGYKNVNGTRRSWWLRSMADYARKTWMSDTGHIPMYCNGNPNVDVPSIPTIPRGIAPFGCI